MNNRGFFVVGPFGLENIGAVLAESGSVYLTEIAVFGTVWGGFPYVVKPAPYKLSRAVLRVSVGNNAAFRVGSRPACGTVAERRALFIVVCQNRTGKREVIYPSALHHRSGFAAVNHPVGVFFVMLVIQPLPIVVSGQFEQVCTFLRIFPLQIIRTAGYISVPARIVKPYVESEH